MSGALNGWMLSVIPQLEPYVYTLNSSYLPVPPFCWTQLSWGSSWLTRGLSHSVGQSQSQSQSRLEGKGSASYLSIGGVSKNLQASLICNNEERRTRCSPSMTLIMNYRKSVLPQIFPIKIDNWLSNFSIATILTFGPDNPLMLGDYSCSLQNVKQHS